MCVSGFREEGVYTPGVCLGYPDGILTEQVSVPGALWLGTVSLAAVQLRLRGSRCRS